MKSFANRRKRIKLIFIMHALFCFILIKAFISADMNVDPFSVFCASKAKSLPMCNVRYEHVCSIFCALTLNTHESDIYLTDF